jgi:F-type H+-transporting ATPase subunit b
VTSRALRAALVVALVPAAAFAEGAAHGGESGATVLWHAFNLVLLLGVIGYFAREPLQRFFATRRRDIEQNLERAAAVLSDAEQRLADWTRRMASLDTEVAGLRSDARERAEAEGRRILADAEVAAERIRRDAGLAVEQEQRRARDTLRKEAADLAIELAAGLIRAQVNDADRARLVDEFIQRIQTAPRGPAARS